MQDVGTQIAGLDRMTTGELAEQYQELHGQPCRTRQRAYLIRKIALRIQANVEGDLSERARKRAAELADDADVRVMAPKTLICPPQMGESATVTRAAPTGQDRPNDPRLPPPGSALVRAYKGRTIRAVVLEDGRTFECNGERFRTLTALTKKITGSHMNGFRFFRLGVQK
jgi:hypothetical protein